MQKERRWCSGETSIITTVLNIYCVKNWSSSTSITRTYSRQAGWQADRQNNDKILKILHIRTRQNITLLLAFDKIQCYYSNTS